MTCFPFKICVSNTTLLHYCKIIIQCVIVHRMLTFAVWS
jgi:hypothetical protein